tara:strand:+ start:43 stop:690 length:648 start_codon:yes stop_codon:yes gene_type:complete
MNNQPWTGAEYKKENALPIKSNKPFWLMHHPNTCWEFVEHKKRFLFLPTFRRLFEIAGVNGVRMIPHNRGGGVDSSMARIKMMDNGFELLDWEIGYQTRYQTKNGGWYYCDIWNAPKVVGGRVIWKKSTDEYNDWRESLLTDGIIKAPDLDILEIFIDRLEKRVERNEGKNLSKRKNSQFQKDVSKLEFMKKYIEIGGPVTISGTQAKKKRVRNV